ncbi:hypothetical protein PG984_013470 [Apiospora sp. TS-2023a]
MVVAPGTLMINLYNHTSRLRRVRGAYTCSSVMRPVSTSHTVPASVTDTDFTPEMLNDMTKEDVQRHLFHYLPKHLARPGSGPLTRPTDVSYLVTGAARLGRLRRHAELAHRH